MITEILILLTAVPSGYLVAWLASDELSAGKIWFKALIVFSLLIGILFAFLGEIHILWSCLYIAVVSGISLSKSQYLKTSEM